MYSESLPCRLNRPRRRAPQYSVIFGNAVYTFIVYRIHIYFYRVNKITKDSA